MYVAFVYVESAQMEYPLDIRIRTLIAAIEDWRPGEIERERGKERERERETQRRVGERAILVAAPSAAGDRHRQREEKGPEEKIQSKILRRSSCPESSMRPKL